ncbi:MAG: hypothetical protein KAJ19_07600 [Gammaproteobacteria bacterium]|nr:hypothetical protein [Gammaproteobacteria bacterium]
MKINVPIELNNCQLDSIATMLDDKVTKRLATRKDIIKLVNKFIGGLTAQADYSAGKVTEETDAPPNSNLYQIKPGEEKFLAGKPPSYIYGWNKASKGAIQI